MEIDAEDVDDIAAVRDTVEDLIEIADSSDKNPFDEGNLVLLYEQLDALHQALSLMVAQRDAMQDDED